MNAQVRTPLEGRGSPPLRRVGGCQVKQIYVKKRAANICQVTISAIESDVVQGEFVVLGGSCSAGLMLGRTASSSLDLAALGRDVEWSLLRPVLWGSAHIVLFWRWLSCSTSPAASRYAGVGLGDTRVSNHLQERLDVQLFLRGHRGRLPGGGAFSFQSPLTN